MAMHQKGRPKIVARRKTKNELIAEAKINKAMKELEAETDKQLDIIWHATALALYRYHSWNNEKINELALSSQNLWSECGEYQMVSMLEMLWDECGIELQAEDKSKRWFELEYLNSDIASMRDMTMNEWLTMRRNQKCWVGPQIMACVLITVHRMEGWKEEAMGKLFQEIEHIKAEFDYDPERLKKASDDETDFMIVDFGDVLPVNE